MKINISLDICKDTDISDIENKIIEESARQMIDGILHNSCGESFKETFEEKVCNAIKNILYDLIDTDYKESIKKEVVKDIAEKYARTKQYKNEIKAYFKKYK